MGMAAIDVVANEKASLEKQNSLLNHQLSEATRRGEEANLTLTDYDSSRKKTVVENMELLRSVEELDNNNMVMGKIKTTLVTQLEETKKISDDESKERSFLLGKFRNLEHEVDLTRGQLEEESQSKADALRMLSKSVGDAQLWRQKYEKEGLARAEELESAKLNLQSDIEEMSQNLDDAQARCSQMEKKAKNFDKIVVEWKQKIDSLQAELDQSQVECRSYSTELFKVKTAYEETMLLLENVRKEKLELQAALEEAESALEQEENKVLRSQLELSQ